MAIIVEENSRVESYKFGGNYDLREFCDILKYELAISQDVATIMKTIEYLERRGFSVHKDHNC